MNILNIEYINYISFVNYTQDEKKAVLFVNSDKNPGDYYIFNRLNNEASYFISTNPKIKPKEIKSNLYILIELDKQK